MIIPRRRDCLQMYDSGQILQLGHSVSDQPMVCEIPLRFRLNVAHLHIMPNTSVHIFSDVGQPVSEGRFLRQDLSVKYQ